MKKYLVAAASVAMLAGVIGIIGMTTNSVSADTETSSADSRGYVSVNASSDKELTPDTAEISISVVTTDPRSLQAATTQNKEISEKVYSQMKKMINANDKDYVKTTNYSANPRYTYTDGRRILDKYQVSNTIVIHTKAISKVGNMIDKAIALGATEVSNMNFSISEYEGECQDLLASATKKARSQADTLAKAAGSSITGVKSITGNCSPYGNSRVQYSMLAKSNSFDAEDAVVGGQSTPVEIGVIKVYANVSTSFFVK